MTHCDIKRVYISLTIQASSILSSAQKLKSDWNAATPKPQVPSTAVFISVRRVQHKTS